MIPGSHRYMRGLGALGVTDAERQRTPAEKVLGIEATGSLKTSGGEGITIGAAPTTILSMLLGAGLGAVVARSVFKGAIVGAVLGAMASTGFKVAQKFGV